MQTPRRAPGGTGLVDRILRCGLSGPLFASLTLVTILALIVVITPGIGPALAVLGALAGLAAVVTSGLAWVSSEPRDRLSWLATWLGAAMMMVGLLMFASSAGQARSGGVHGSERVLVSAVPLLLAAALLRVDGELITFRTLKLVADILVLGLTIVIGFSVVCEVADLFPSASNSSIVEAGVFAGAYVCLAFGWVVVARPFLLHRSLAAPSVIAWGCTVLAAGACLQSLAMVGLFNNVWIGTPFWVAGLVSVAYGAYLSPRTMQGASADRTDASSLFGSRLHLAPSVCAVALLALIWSGQAFAFSTPSLAVYLASNVLAGLIVTRLIITVFENTSLLERVENTIEDEESLRDLGVALNSSLDLRRVFQHVCKIGAVIMRADQAVLWLVDRRSQELEIVELVGRPRDDYVGRRNSLADIQSIAVRVVRTGRPEILTYAHGSAKANPFLNTMFHSECLLAVPFVRQDHQPVGALVFSNSRNPTAFQPRDIARAEVLAVQAVVAMDNARLYGAQNDRLQEMSALCQIAQAASRSVSTHELCKELLVILKDVVDYRSATVYLADPGTGVLRAAVHDTRSASDSGRVPRPVGPSPPAAEAFVEAHSVSRIYEPNDPDASRASPPTRVRLAVPLLSRELALGVVEVESPQPDAFDRTSVDLLTSLAHNAALAIENVNLMEETRQVEALKELDRLKDELLATVSHELRTPLGSIKGYSTTLMKHEAKLSADERQEFYMIIDEEADRLNELIGNLLDLSSLQAGMLSMRREPIHLQPIARTAVARASRRSERHSVQLEWDVDPTVLADPKRIEQVFMNLLVNAIKYSPDGGAVTMKGWVEGSTLLVSVSDEGVGIPGGEVARIFDRFHRVEGELKHRVGGSGLGLAICRRLVDTHQGRIWVESQLGHGSTFYIQLPINGKE